MNKPPTDYERFKAGYDAGYAKREAEAKEIQFQNIEIKKLLVAERDKLRARVERLERALEELVSQHMRDRGLECKVYGHLVRLAKEALKEAE